MFKQALIRLSTILIAGIAFAAGLVGSRLLSHAIGLSAPRMPAQAPESIAGYYLITGSIILSGGLALPATGISASLPVRWLVLATFVFLGFAVSTTIETSIFSSAAGTMSMIPALLLPCILLAGVLAAPCLTPFPTRETEGRIVRFFRARPWPEWTWRIAAAVVSFPLIYFVFGLMASPVVSDYYASGVSGLALPAPASIVRVQFLRSILHLVSLFPLLILWRGDRRHIVVGLTLAFFVFIFAYDIVLANQIPAVLVLVHGLEVLVDSLVYAWAVVHLLMPDKTRSIQKPAA